jgi:hypothetical protein
LAGVILSASRKEAAMGIAEEALKGVMRKTGGYPTASGWCLGFAFEAVARAYGSNRWDMYSRILDKSGVDIDRSRWAIDAERAIVKLGLAVTEIDADPSKSEQRTLLKKLLTPGDLLFSSLAMDEGTKSSRTARDKEGHIGIYIGPVAGEGKDVLYVAENTRAQRGRYWGKPTALRLTLLDHWDTVTTIGRLKGKM